MPTVRYLLNCTTGLEAVVALRLPEDVPGLRVVDVQSGLLRCESGREVGDALLRCRYLSSTLRLVDQVTAPSLDDAATVATRRLSRAPRLDRSVGRSFRLRVFDAGQPAPLDRARRRQLESTLERWLGVPSDPGRGQVEVWLSRRRGERHVALAVRLDRPERRRAAAGELKVDVAAAVVLAVRPRTRETVWDPFAGSGALVAERARRPLGAALASDADCEAVGWLQARSARGELGKRSKVFVLDFTDLAAVRGVVEPASVDTFVTDPPWGVFDRMEEPELQQFYRLTWASIDHCLAGDGRAVLLVAREIADMVAASSPLGLDAGHPLLVNGRKASLLCFERSGSAAG